MFMAVNLPQHSILVAFVALRWLSTVPRMTANDSPSVHDASDLVLRNLQAKFPRDEVDDGRITSLRTKQSAERDHAVFQARSVFPRAPLVVSGIGHFSVFLPDSAKLAACEARREEPGEQAVDNRGEWATDDSVTAG
jgi:hypothetical protein